MAQLALVEPAEAADIGNLLVRPADPANSEDSNVAIATKKLQLAWKQYQRTERYGLEFGQVCCELRDEFKSHPGASNKGKGFLPILEQNSIPESTAYWWMDRYEVSIGKKADNHRAMGTGENEWYTPQKYIDAARKAMGGIDLDPATSAKAQERIQAEKFFTKKQNGLEREWAGNVWLNPPYTQPDIDLFVKKMVKEVKAAHVSQAVLLTHNYTDTSWFHLAESCAALICFTRGRIKFVDAEDNECVPTQGQAFFYYGKDGTAFQESFASFGFIVSGVTTPR